MSATATVEVTDNVVVPPEGFSSVASAVFGSEVSGTYTVTTSGLATPVISMTGALPAGVTFTDNGDGSATLAGTPAPGSSGTYALAISVRDDSTLYTQDFTLTVIGPTVLATGYTHRCALTIGGGVKCRGANNTGQLGNTTVGDSIVPVDVEGLTSPARAIIGGYYHTAS